MNQEERLNYLLGYLCSEYSGTGKILIPDSYAQKRALLRSFVNVRPPSPVSDDFISVQDAFLQEEARKKGIVTLNEIPPCAQNNRISLWQGDITRLQVDAIVNAANSGMLGCFAPEHHCIDNAIHTASGVQLREECHAMMQRQGHPEETGTAKITLGYNLPAKYVIHTVGPIVQGEPTEKQRHELAACYTSCLELAAASEIRSIAFCCISTGIFAFPKELAAKIATEMVKNFLKMDDSIDRVIFNVFTDDDLAIYEKLLGKKAI